MHNVLLLGAGKIGTAIAKFLSQTGDYDILVGDIDEASLRRIDRTRQCAAPSSSIARDSAPHSNPPCAIAKASSPP